MYVSYILLVASVAVIGWIVESNASQTQNRQCAALAAQIRINVELVLYTRALLDGKESLGDLAPTPAGQELADDVRKQYIEVCDAALPE